MHDPYVRDIVWMTDDDNDGTWEIYEFNEDGYLDTSISKSGWTWDFGRYGIHDTYGYLTTNYYKGAWSNMGLIRLYAVEIHGTAKTVHFQIFQTHVGVLLVIIPVMRLRLLADLTMNSAV